MSFHRAAAAIGVVLASMTPVKADPRTRIQVRFYTLTPLTDAELTGALESAQRIFAQAAVSVEWLDCSSASAEAAPPLPCITRLGGNDFLLRFAASPGATTASDPLGLSIVDGTSRAGVLATVYVDRVNRAANAFGVNRLTLMGRVAAHEIGHLLLGLERHARTGLMRADWSPTSLQRGSLRDWSFSKEEGHRMQAGIIARERQRQHAIARLNPQSVIEPR
jgi:hypothetical protein